MHADIQQVRLVHSPWKNETRGHDTQQNCSAKSKDVNDIASDDGQERKGQVPEKEHQHKRVGARPKAEEEKRKAPQKRRIALVQLPGQVLAHTQTERKHKGTKLAMHPTTSMRQ